MLRWIGREWQLALGLLRWLGREWQLAVGRLSVMWKTAEGEVEKSAGMGPGTTEKVLVETLSEYEEWRVGSVPKARCRRGATRDNFCE